MTGFRVKNFIRFETSRILSRRGREHHTTAILQRRLNVTITLCRNRTSLVTFDLLTAALGPPMTQLPTNLQPAPHPGRLLSSSERDLVTTGAAGSSIELAPAVVLPRSEQCRSVAVDEGRETSIDTLTTHATGGIIRRRTARPVWRVKKPERVRKRKSALDF